MTYTDDAGTECYRTDNVVTAFEEGRLIEWDVAAAGGEPLGWRWRYELERVTADKTAVTLTYEWTGTSEENKRRYGVPLFDEAALAASLALLAQAVTSLRPESRQPRHTASQRDRLGIARCAPK